MAGAILSYFLISDEAHAPAETAEAVSETAEEATHVGAVPSPAD